MTRTRAIDDREPFLGDPTPVAQHAPSHATRRCQSPGFLVLGLLLCHAVVRADAAPRSYAIPTQSLNDALMDFAVQSDLELVVPADLIRGLPSRGLAGDYTPDEGLQRLLAGTGIQYRLDGNTLTIERAEDPLPMAQASPEAAPAEPETPEDAIITLPALTVTGTPIDDTSYNVLDASTATKTDTPIMETPFSVKVVPQQVLQDQQVFRLEKALQNVSGVTQFPGNQGGSDGFIIRGFLSNNVYRDGFLIPDILGGSSSKRDTANLERIEVLKGPGSLLFGRTEPGGIINVVTKQPLATPYYSLQQQLGSFDFYRTAMDATGPVTKDDTLLYRFNLAYENADSFRDFVENERVFLAPVLRWNISPRTQATLELEFQHFDDPQDPGIPPIGNRPAPVPRERFVGEPLNNKNEGDRVLAGFHWSHEFNEKWTLRHQFLAELWDFDAPASSLFFGPAAPDGTLNRFFNNALEEISTDRYFTSVNLTGKVSTSTLKHTLLFGFDYFRIDNKIPGINCCPPAPPFNIFDPVYLTEAPVFDPTQSFDVDRTESWYGLYSQDQIELPYNLFALAGFRYDNAEGSDNVLALKNSEDDRVSPRGGLLWRPLQWLSLYGSYTENFGGANGQNTDGTFLPPETAQQWEAGAKTEFWDGRLSATFAYFDLTKQNISVTDPANPLFNRTIGEAESRGVELDVAGEVLPGWQMIGAYSYLPFAEITKDVGDDGGPGNTGKRFFLAPRHAGSLWSTYEFKGGDLTGLKLGAGVVGAGQREGTPFGPPDYQLPGFAIVNLLASYSLTLGPTKLTAQLNVDNLLDKTYFVGTNGGNFITIGAPRTFLGSIRVEF